MLPRSILSRSLFLLVMFAAVSPDLAAQDVHDRVEHHFADNYGVKIHYVSLGKGPLIVMIHGFPDYWYSWRDQMAELSKTHRVIALDQRGYNKSDKPEGVDKYSMETLVSDVAAVIKHADAKTATIMGHDWGGAVAWSFAISKPEMTERLIILNLPHFRGLSRELAKNGDQARNSQYARNFQEEGAHERLSADRLSNWVKEPDARKRYVEAFKRSSFESMLNYYKKNYPRPPYKEDTTPVVKVKAPVLMFHGLDDWALLPSALNDTWKWVEKDLTLVTVPGAGHWVHRDKPAFVTKRLVAWLKLSAEE